LFVGNIEYAWDIIDVGLCFQFMVFNATFNNISVILWLLVLLVEEARVPEESKPLTNFIT
jgi:hypothetical protein